MGEPAGSRCKVVGRCVVNLSLVDRFSASPSKTYVHFGPVAGDVTSLSVDETPDAVWDLVKPASAEGSVRS